MSLCCECATFQNTQQQHGKVQPLFSFCLCLAGAGLAGSSPFCQASSQHQTRILLAPLPEHLSSFAFPLSSGSSDICLPHDTSEVFAPVGREECTVCFSFQTTLQLCPLEVCSRSDVTGCFSDQAEKDKARGNFFQQDRIPKRSHVWSGGRKLYPV